MRVFVTGGTGYLGSVVLQDLVAAEHEVVALVRDPKRLVVRGVQSVSGSLEDISAWEEALRGCDACVHTVGILREDPDHGVTFEKVHYQYTVNLLRACAKLGVEHFVYISANGVERALPFDYMRTKGKAEQAVRASSLEWTILRPSVIFGGRPDCYNFVGAIREPLHHAPAFPYFGDGRYRLAPVSADEVSEAVVASLAKPEARGQVYHLCGPETYTYKALLTLMNDIGGFKTRLFPLPWFVVEGAAGLLGGMGWFPLTPTMLKMLKNGNACPEGVKTGQALEVPFRSFEQWLRKTLPFKPQLPEPAPYVEYKPEKHHEPDVGGGAAKNTVHLDAGSAPTQHLSADDGPATHTRHLNVDDAP